MTKKTNISRRGAIKAIGGSVTLAAAGRDALAATAAVPAPGQAVIMISNYMRYWPLATGDIKPADPAITWLRADRGEVLTRVMADATIAGGEGSLARHLIRLDRGDRSMVALPVFILRNFTVRDLYILKGSKLTPKKLFDRSVGLTGWDGSGATWWRQTTRYFGNDTRSVKWVIGGTDQAKHVDVGVPMPKNAEHAPDGMSLSDLLISGRIDAFYSPMPPKKYDAGQGPIVRMVPDYRAAELRYFKETGCFPAQHILLLRRAVWEKKKALARDLYDTFTRCETHFAAGQRHFPYNTPWSGGEVERTELAMGPDFHAHGIEKNKRDLEMFIEAAVTDGLLGRKLTLNECFSEFLGT